MNRRNFFKKLGIGAISAPIAAKAVKAKPFGRREDLADHIASMMPKSSIIDNHKLDMGTRPKVKVKPYIGQQTVSMSHTGRAILVEWDGKRWEFVKWLIK